MGAEDIINLIVGTIFILWVITLIIEEI